MFNTVCIIDCSSSILIHIEIIIVLFVYVKVFLIPFLQEVFLLVNLLLKLFVFSFKSFVMLAFLHASLEKTISVPLLTSQVCYNFIFLFQSLHKLIICLVAISVRSIRIKFVDSSLLPLVDLVQSIVFML